MSALSAANAARQNAALDKPRRFPGGRVSTFRNLIDSGYYAYRQAYSMDDDSIEYRLITHESAEKIGMQDMSYADASVCGKFVFDYAADILPTVFSYWDDDSEIVPAGNDAEIDILFRPHN